MNVGYFEGAEISVVASALNKFGSQSYTSANNTISFSSLQSNIGNKKGMVAGCYAYYSNTLHGHAVLIAGYHSTENNIMYYNPGTDTLGASSVITNNSTTSPISFVFTYNGYSYRWYYTAY